MLQELIIMPLKHEYAAHPDPKRTRTYSYLRRGAKRVADSWRTRHPGPLRLPKDGQRSEGHHAGAHGHVGSPKCIRSGAFRPSFCKLAKEAGPRLEL